MGWLGECNRRPWGKCYLCDMGMEVYAQMQALRQQGRKALAVLVDPQSVSVERVEELLDRCLRLGVDYFFVGGSLVAPDRMRACVRTLKGQEEIPVVVFPGSVLQVDDEADALLLLSVISGRNPDLLIGRHVEAAPMLERAELEIIPTGYLLIGGGGTSSVMYLSNTVPIPRERADLVAYTALAGQMLGLKVLYLEAGSGSSAPVPEEVVRRVRRKTALPLIVGGGIRSASQALRVARAGADIVVVGNALEREPDAVDAIAEVLHNYTVSFES